MVNESGQFDSTEKARQAWGMLMASWHDWSVEDRVLFCWMADFDYESIVTAKRDGETI